MFKRKKSYRKLISLFIISLIFLLTFLLSSAYSVLKQTLNISGTASTLSSQNSNDVSFNVDSWFDGNLYYYKISMTATNKQHLPFSSWDVSMDIPYDANLISNSGITAYILNSRIMCNNVNYNGILNPNQSVNFEFQFSTSLSKYTPTNIIFNGNLANEPSTPSPGPDEIIPLEDMDITFSITNEWKNTGYNYYQYDVKVSNNNNKLSTKSWRFNITLPKNTTVQQFWNVNLKTNSDSNIKIEFSSLDYNGIIPPNSSIIFGLIIETKTKNYIPEAENLRDLGTG